VLIAIIALYVLLHPSEVVRLWQSLLDWIALLFGGKRARSAALEANEGKTTTVRARPRFAAFTNPFAQNLRGWQAAQVVEHTFAALEAWAAEHGRARQADQTAEEFARRLAAEVPQLVRLPVLAAGMLDRVMFAGWRPSERDLAPLSELWRVLLSLDFLSSETAPPKT
jgi:hypothetical protein